MFAIEVLAEEGAGAADGAMIAFIRLELQDNSVIRFGRGSEWRTAIDATDDWHSIKFDDSTWEIAGELQEGSTTQPWPPRPAKYLRRNFEVKERVTKARLYTTALGAYEGRVNGLRVGNDLLAPESTAFDERVLYRTYDVTRMLRLGKNTLGLLIGDGWYASSRFGVGRYPWAAMPCCALAQLEITFEDGSQEIVATGPEWRLANSPILRSEIYNGEMYDARLALERWDIPEFDDSQWMIAEIADQPSCQLSAQTSSGIHATQTIRPTSISSPTPGIYVVDFGQNLAGWCRLRARGPAGTRIEMRFAEMRLPSGLVDQSNLRAARQTDTFILRGDSSDEVFTPSFTYHGFRYVQISGLTQELMDNAIEAVVVHSDLRTTGTLRIANPLIQKIWQNIVWTQCSNLVGVPTDCPQRDERLGYLADAGIFWDSAAFNMDVCAFTRKFMDSVRACQSPQGVYPMYAPNKSSSSSAKPGWADGGVILPWTVWQHYGDVGVIEENWEGMARYLRFILDRNPDFLWRNGRFDIGDWLAVDEKPGAPLTTPGELISTAYWAHSANLLSQMAVATGRQSEATALRTTHGRIRSAFNRAFVKPDGEVGNGSQTGYVLTLKYNLVPTEVSRVVAKRLAADIRRRGGALSTGFLGTQYLLDVLADTGYVSLAYDLLLRTAPPSWGYMVNQGATTIWESWNGRVWANEKGETMPCSQNHYALGAICGFLYRRIAGIDASTPGFRTVRVRPVFDDRLKRAGGDYDSVMGRISTDWSFEADRQFSLDVTIPPNAAGLIHLPAQPTSRIRESSKDISSRSEIHVASRSAQEAVVEVESGSYRFTVGTS